MRGPRANGPDPPEITALAPYEQSVRPETFAEVPFTGLSFSAQRKPTTLDEFKGNVIAVETAPFWDDELERLMERRERSKDPEADFTPEERKRLEGASNGGYHYLGAAKIMAPIGRAFANALIGARGAKPQ